MHTLHYAHVTDMQITWHCLYIMLRIRISNAYEGIDSALEVIFIMRSTI